MQPTVATPINDRRVIRDYIQAGEHGPAAIARVLPPTDDAEYLDILQELIQIDVNYYASIGELRSESEYWRAFGDMSPPQSSGPESGSYPMVSCQTPMPTGPTRCQVPRKEPVASDAPTNVRGENDEKVAFPSVGDQFAGFTLVEELGRGGFACVFLAEETRLAGRLVVLKITNQASNESQRLARLQHTNIVPIQNAFSLGRFHALQMPYYGRQTLADLLNFVREEVHIPRLGRRVFSTTIVCQTTSHGSRSSQDSKSFIVPNSISDVSISGANVAHPIREMLASLPYVSAVVWISARLADGLAHAHARGILHLDLKPHNVLFSDDGHPMLLDFNLGYDQSRQDRERIGGTWPYMAPEQIEEYANVPGAKVDNRSDLYALGVLMFEMLTGQLPFPKQRRGAGGLAEAVAVRRAGAPRIRPLNADVSPALEALIRKLMAPNPDDR